MHFSSINPMPAGLSPLNDVCKICQIEVLALLLTQTRILTFSHVSKYDHRCEIGARLPPTSASLLFYAAIPYFLARI